MTFNSQVAEIIPRCRGVESFRFSCPGSFSYKPGQFMDLSLKARGKSTIKHFTISSSPTEKERIEFTKKLPGSPCAAALKRLREGDRVRISGPFGFFSYQRKTRKVGMIPGGRGMSPQLRDLGMPETRIKPENFPGYETLHVSLH
ncbi:MAG: FAD-dependent oxidoreductase [Candidatus Aminicenantales bacterium]